MNDHERKMREFYVKRAREREKLKADLKKIDERTKSRAIKNSSFCCLSLIMFIIGKV